MSAVAGSADDEAGAWGAGLEQSVYGKHLWILPGKGDSGEGCGDWIPTEFCEAGHVEFSPDECQRRSCPESSCNHRWRQAAAAAICTRVGAARFAAPDGEKRAIHAVASPPEGEVLSRREFYDMIGDAYDLAKAKGVRGGVAIPHGYRVKESVKREIQAAREAGEFEGGDWKYVRNSDRHWRDLTYWSPHVHIIGWVGSNDVGESDPESDDGWIFKNIRSLAPFTLRDESGYEDMVSLAAYLMSHVTFEEGEGRQAYRWFGELANAKFSPESALSVESAKRIEETARRVAGLLDEEDEEPVCHVEDCDCPQHPIWQAEQFALQNSDELPKKAVLRLLCAPFVFG